MTTTTVHEVFTAPVAALPLPPPGPAEPALLLPEPLLAGEASLDALGRLLAMVEEQGLESAKVTEHRLEKTQERLREKLEQLLFELREAVDKAEEGHRHRKKGLFAKVAEAVGEVASKIVGAAVEVVHDSVTVPADLAVSFVKHAGNWQALRSALREDLGQLMQRSDMQKSVESFVEGTTRFAGTLLDFSTILALSVACDVGEGEPLGRALASQAEELWASLKENILDNPGFWEVVSTVAKAAAVAGTVMTGGALAVVAVALLVVMEADKRYGFVEEAFGKETAPWVHVGLEVAFAACTAVAAAGSETELAVKLLQSGTSVVGGTGGVYQGIKALEAGDRLADEKEQQAALQAALNQMAQLQRMVDALLELLKDRSESHDTTRRLESSVAEAAAGVEAAVVVMKA